MARPRIPQPSRGLYRIDKSGDYMLKVDHRGDNGKATYRGPKSIRPLLEDTRKEIVVCRKGEVYDNFLEREGRFTLPKELVYRGEP